MKLRGTAKQLAQAAGVAVVTVAVAIVLLLLGANSTVVTILMVVAIAVLGVWLPMRQERARQNALKADAEKTCMPIIKRYQKKHSVKRLLSDYEEWKEGEHDDELRVLFAEDVTKALIKNERFDKAREVADEGRVIAKRCGLGKEFDEFADACETLMAKTEAERES